MVLSNKMNLKKEEKKKYFKKWNIILMLNNGFIIIMGRLLIVFNCLEFCCNSLLLKVQIFFLFEDTLQIHGYQGYQHFACCPLEVEVMRNVIIVILVSFLVESREARNAHKGWGCIVCYTENKTSFAVLLQTHVDWRCIRSHDTSRVFLAPF